MYSPKFIEPFLTGGYYQLAFLCCDLPSPNIQSSQVLLTKTIKTMLQEKEKTELQVSTVLGDMLINLFQEAYTTYLHKLFPGFGHLSKAWEDAYENYGIHIIEGLEDYSPVGDWTKSDLDCLKLVIRKTRLILEEKALHGPPYTPNLDCGVPLLCPQFISDLFDHLEIIKPALSLVRLKI